MTTWKSEKKSQYHRNRRLLVVEWLKTERKKCKECGIEDSRVLEFHHRDAKKKKFSLTGSLCYSRSRKSISEEIDKCDVLCANCHRIEEDEIRKSRVGGKVSP